MEICYIASMRNCVIFHFVSGIFSNEIYKIKSLFVFIIYLNDFTNSDYYIFNSDAVFNISITFVCDLYLKF
ncbi:hypothetical protein XBJ1_0384 [Xenorhabdus bovienii SS-2004]|uniref:Uncharacterized protein n=1 Tax=Xenorhabdus bovienii (strain SS-2004) TaxID=406818 RepID=D3UZ06_XENBS|nr:hypothetical protein XBJ1_0384 [Xenorhabdus bovienii SS-2004]